MRNTFAMFIGHGMRIVLQAFYFILIARGLGTDGYGAFVGVASLACILAPFSSWGSGHILIKHVARNRDKFKVYWGNALFVTTIFSVLLTLFMVFSAKFLFAQSISLNVILEIAIADLFFARILDLCSQAFQGFERLNLTSTIQVLANLFRFLAILALTLSGLPLEVEMWTKFYLWGSILSTSISLFLVSFHLGLPSIDFREMFRELKEGLYFSISVSAQNIYNDVDKTMLAKLSTLNATGIYGAAYRIIDVSFVPVRSLLAASYSKFFQHGHEKGLKGNLEFMKKILLIPIVYCIGIAILMSLCAPLIQLVLGMDFKESSKALQLLCLIPLLKTLHHFAADSLSGAGYQGLRSFVQISIAIFNVLINLWLIPKYSWTGAVISSLISDGLLVITLWLILSFYVNKEKTPIYTEAKVS
ncbi:MAG: oligosaccharide flippase family protein [Candidatus Caenarcaniphilales bacterium]|nr:oligosaccharide flippase family protein [Candidatus Caenarcaniphilales bacterium]